VEGLADWSAEGTSSDQAGAEKIINHRARKLRSQASRSLSAKSRLTPEPGAAEQLGTTSLEVVSWWRTSVLVLARFEALKTFFIGKIIFF
jgi:hypothetical protein